MPFSLLEGVLNLFLISLILPAMPLPAALEAHARSVLAAHLHQRSVLKSPVIASLRVAPGAARRELNLHLLGHVRIEHAARERRGAVRLIVGEGQPQIVRS